MEIFVEQNNDLILCYLKSKGHDGIQRTRRMIGNANPGNSFQ